MYGFILRVPAVGLVAEMRAGLDQLLHGDVGGRHGLSPSGYASAGPRNRLPEQAAGTGMMALHVEWRACSGELRVNQAGGLAEQAAGD